VHYTESMNLDVNEVKNTKTCLPNRECRPGHRGRDEDLTVFLRKRRPGASVQRFENVFRIC
jgi:hypothetical protein